MNRHRVGADPGADTRQTARPGLVDVAVIGDASVAGCNRRRSLVLVVGCAAYGKDAIAVGPGLAYRLVTCG
jgi:hypothetical protein